MAIIQTVLSPNPVMASSIDVTLNSTHTVIAMMATPAIGNGWLIQPIIVATKIANMCQAFKETPAGLNGDRNQINSPIKIGQMSFLYFT